MREMPWDLEDVIMEGCTMTDAIRKLAEQAAATAITCKPDRKCLPGNDEDVCIRCTAAAITPILTAALSPLVEALDGLHQVLVEHIAEHPGQAHLWLQDAMKKAEDTLNAFSAPADDRLQTLLLTAKQTVNAANAMVEYGDGPLLAAMTKLRAAVDAFKGVR